jgi:putative membrane protein
MELRPIAFTVVTLASFAALPALAQDVDVDAEEEAIEEVVDDVIADDDDPTPTIESDLPVTVPEADATPVADPQRRLETPEAVFVADALHDGAMQLAAAALARDRSENGEVKALAQRIEEDFEAFNVRLEKLPQSVAATEPRGRPAHPEMARLQALEGEAFDAAWLAVEEKHYRQAIDKFERAAASPALELDVRSAATEGLATLRAHADAIRDLIDSLGFE